MKFFWCVALLSAIALSAAQGDAISQAVAALQSGDLASAEQILSAELKQRPNNADALEVLGVVLDQEKKYTEAEAVYRRAIALSPHSPPILNNYGNHLVTTGKREEARAMFLKVLALNPQQVNACVQLSRIALQNKSAAEAACLDRLPASAQEAMDVSILRMQVDYALGRNAAANQLLAQISRPADSDARLSFSLGVALSAVKQYDKAETFFARTVNLAPGNFEALYDLGLAASHAGHKQRARDILQQALEQQPDNVDVLYDLAAVTAELGQKPAALELLARAARLAPERADIERLVAYTSADLGYFGDAAQAWERYLKLVPGDAVARREHAFAETALGEDTKNGIADLEQYVRTHPTDPIGHYELGTAESPSDRDQALEQLDRAVALKPDLAAARVARGLLRYRQGNASAALVDFEAAAKREPTNPIVLDRLGETYMAVGRSADAVEVLRKAAELAPRDSTVLLHLGRALTNLGQPDEAKAVFARYRELGPSKSELLHPAGLVDFLSLSPDEQFARYRAGVERTVQKNPDNAEAQVRYLGLLLTDRNNEEAAAVARKILALKPSPALLAEAAGTLLAAEQYAFADEFLRQANELAPQSNELQLDSAIAAFQVADARTGLEKIDRIPPDERTGDYYLARMQMLEALGRDQEAESALKQALRAKPMHPELYRQIALLLIKKGRTPEARQLLDEGAGVLPNDPDIPLLRMLAASPGVNPQDSERLLNDLANRWPESYKIWSQAR